MSENIIDTNAGEAGNLVREYMERAARARALGDNMLGLHLFLAAYGQASTPNEAPTGLGLSALKEAWALALKMKERSLCEYIFEKMEPSLSAAEVKSCSASLQGLALDKLSEYGISMKDLHDVSEAVAREMHADGSALPAGIHEITMFPGILGPSGIGAPSAMRPAHGTDELPDQIPPQPAALHEVNDGQPAKPAAEDSSAKAQSAPAASAKPDSAPLPASADAPFFQFGPQTIRYTDLAGYANAIREAKALGIGQERDPRYSRLVQDLNAAHGLAEPPALDPILISAPVREDASRFAYATVGELDLPLFRMFVEDNPHGLQALCMAAQANNDFKYDRRTGTFMGKGILLLEDVDLWEIPVIPESTDEGVNAFMAAQMSRGLREVYNFIRAAVDDPDVRVLVTCQSDGELAPFFLDLLEPFKEVAIEMPNPGERASIWMQLVNDHPSLNGISVAMLVKNSANMARYDIYMAVADVLDESYRDDLNNGKASPVKASRLFEKLAAYQPLDSEEYKTLEEAIISDFRSDLANIDELLNQ